MIKFTLSLLLLVTAVQCGWHDIYVNDELACDADTRPDSVWTNETVPGIFSSPNWNDTYPPNALCEWLITTDEDETVQLNFIDFDVEYCTNCRCDALRVWDGSSTDDELIGEFCWRAGDPNPPEFVQTSGNQMFVQFTSDDIGEYRGFMVRYYIPYVSTACTIQRPEYMPLQYGTIMSPDFPANYPNNANCQWWIHAPEGQRVRIVTAAFELESGCYDYLEVFDGDSSSAPRIGRHFGTNDHPPQMVSSGQDMFLWFQTDSSITYSGFFIAYQHEDNPNL